MKRNKKPLITVMNRAVENTRLRNKRAMLEERFPFPNGAIRCRLRNVRVIQTFINYKSQRFAEEKKSTFEYFVEMFFI